MKIVSKHPIGLSRVIAFPLFRGFAHSSASRESLNRLRTERLVVLMRPMGLVNMFNSLCTAGYLLGKVNTVFLISWLLPMLMFAAFQIGNSYRFSSWDSQRPSSGRMVRKAELVSLIIGAWWAMLLALFHGVSPDVTQFTFYIVAGMVAGVAAIAAGLTTISGRFMAGVLAILVPLVIIGGIPLAFAAGAVTLFCAAAYSALNNERQLLELVEREQSLIKLSEIRVAAFEAFNGAVAYFDRDGQVLCYNSRHEEWFGSRNGIFEEDGLVVVSNGVWALRKITRMPGGEKTVVHTDVHELINAKKAADDALRAAEASERTVRAFAKHISASVGGDVRVLRAYASGQRVLATQPQEAGRMVEVANEISERAARVGDAVEDLALLVKEDEQRNNGALFIEEARGCIVDAVKAWTNENAESCHRVRSFGSREVFVTGQSATLIRRIVERVVELVLANTSASISVGVGENGQGSGFLVVAVERTDCSPDELVATVSGDSDNETVGAIVRMLAQDTLLLGLMTDIGDRLGHGENSVVLKMGKRFGAAEPSYREGLCVETARCVATAGG